MARAAGTSWNPAPDFKLAPNQANPAPGGDGSANVWWYMQAPDAGVISTTNPGAYTRLPNFTASAFGVSGLEEWNGGNPSTSSTDLEPAIGINASGAAQTLPVISTVGFLQQFVWPVGSFRIHPWTNNVVLGWRSPITGTVAISGSVTDADPGGCYSPSSQQMWITKNSTDLVGIANGWPDLSNIASLRSIPVVSGDFIYFVVGPNSVNPACGNTIWNLSITGVGATAVVSGFEPKVGPYTGGTGVVITGNGFTPGISVSFGNAPASAVHFVDSTKIIAVAPPIPMDQAGAISLIVGGGTASASFTYFVPQIGVLIIHDPNASDPTHVFASCTASVVNSSSGSVVATAGHCVAEGGHPDLLGLHVGHLGEDWAFAPGYVGILCPFASIPPPVTAAAFLRCGYRPHGIWVGNMALADPAFLLCTNPLIGPSCPNHNRDYGFVAITPQLGLTIQTIVGSLPIQFNQGRSQFWQAYGQPGTSLVHCSGTPQSFDAGTTTPPQMQITTCPTDSSGSTFFVSGSSGGPWISSGGSVGGVNSTSGSTVLNATYLGSEAQSVFSLVDGMAIGCNQTQDQSGNSGCRQ